MVGLDTNVVVRLLMNDEPAQAKRADAAFLAHARSDGVLVTHIVLAEVTWVLAQCYDLDRGEIHARLRDLVRTRGVVVEDAEVVERVLDRYEHGKADLADLLIVAKARLAGASHVLTFDKKLAGEEGAKLL